MILPAAYVPLDRDAAVAPLPLHLVDRAGLPGWLAGQSPAVAQWVAAHGHDASPNTLLPLPGEGGAVAGAILGIGDRLDPFAYAHAPSGLPGGDWRVHGELDAAHRRALQLGWGLGAYRFSRYRSAPRPPARLAIDTFDAGTDAVLAACLRVRDLVNTPTEDLGPAQLEEVARDIALAHGGELEAIVGEELLQRNFPAIHAVGRASHRAPRLLVLRWGQDAAPGGNHARPHLVIVGKGVCFDSGGLNIKVADGMRNMKKDMGGAAHALALAELVMAQRLPVRLTVLVPAVENAIGPDAFRPGEVIATRTGVHVEIDNTDAEGRVVLGDALAYAGELAPDLLLDFATLTGAARVALGPDLPALYSNDDALAADWVAAGASACDHVWRMPLWRPYLRYLTSNIADLANSGPSRMGGSITAALYLERFVPPRVRWAHLDVYSWNDADRPGRPAGGEAQGLRSAWQMLATRYA